MAGMSISFAHCIMVVFLCTITTTQIMLNSVSMQAESVESIMSGVLHMEYASCRAFFLTGLTTFLLAVAAKVFSIFVGQTTSNQDVLIGGALVSFFVHTVAAQQAYTNSVISASLGNLGVLYIHAMKMWLSKFHLFSGIAGFVQSVAYFTFVGLMAARLVSLLLGK